MKAAFTIWNGRIAPVFDVAGQVMLVDSNGEQDPHTIINLPCGSACEKIIFLQQLHVQVLVCGAMTRRTARYAHELNMEVFPFIAGEQQEIIDTWLSKHLLDKRFCMPGCGRNDCFRKHRGGQGRRGRNSRQHTAKPPED
ncbi:MAG: hypothetical protein U9R29_08445 [Thermodesulfobacteriota bacterium]|nr:hypothetical protein [Thermodesulfobacteriota bacterium]